MGQHAAVSLRVCIQSSLFTHYRLYWLWRVEAGKVNREEVTPVLPPAVSVLHPSLCCWPLSALSLLFFTLWCSQWLIYLSSPPRNSRYLAGRGKIYIIQNQPFTLGLSPLFVRPRMISYSSPSGWSGYFPQDILTPFLADRSSGCWLLALTTLPGDGLWAAL